MKFFRLEAIAYTLLVTGFVLLIAALQSCDATDPVPVSENHLPVEQNFHHGKIWTDADFQAAEVDPDTVNYYTPCQTACPDDITADDLAQIEKHHREQMKKLTAGATK